uniref:Uncharacterized protein n=1 Tax=Rhizophagus irregularis (strain DAOM 181602 / DAOM 197198 / MUCL 43194) TaxID=747089 RepID=U9UUU7_RHIID
MLGKFRVNRNPGQSNIQKIDSCPKSRGLDYEQNFLKLDLMMLMAFSNLMAARKVTIKSEGIRFRSNVISGLLADIFVEPV